MTNDQAITLHKALSRFMRKSFKCSAEDADDAASFGITVAIQRGMTEFTYLASCAKNHYLTEVNSRPQVAPLQDDEADDIAIARSTPANQDIHLVARECVQAIEGLAPETRDVMRLVAMGWEQDEIARKLNIRKSEVNYRSTYGRHLLRARDLHDLTPKRGHRRFIGIKRHHKRWQATITVDGEFHYLGNFASASDAAKAYDAKARQLLGDLAKLNYPDVNVRADQE